MTDISYEIEAFNTATESENRIHDDSIAKRFGFQGGLVPGVDVYAYLTRAAALHFGSAFLEQGIIRCRFDLPVYDGETVTVSGRGDGELSITLSARSKSLATATASLSQTASVPKMESYGIGPLPTPASRPAASASILSEGRVLGTLTETTSVESQASYLRDVRETLPLYADEGVVHPGFLLRRANSALKDNVELGPWIHVGSTVQHFSPLKVGADLETRSKVARCYDHKGHGFVELDVGLFSNGVAIARIDHTAIYEPRQVRQSA